MSMYGTVDLLILQNISTLFANQFWLYRVPYLTFDVENDDERVHRSFDTSKCKHSIC